MRKTCEACSQDFEAKSARRKYCDKAKCKQSRYRARKAGRVVELVPAPEAVDDDQGDDKSREGEREGLLTAATRKQLENAGRLDTALGVAALLLAIRLDGVGLADTGSGVAALIKEHRAALAEAVKDAKTEADPLDKIRESAALKLISGGAR